MKALKIIGIVFGGLIALIAVASGVFYVGWLKAPSQQEVCDNLVPILMANTQKHAGLTDDMQKVVLQAAKPELEKSCMESTAVPEFGKLKYATQMKCLKVAKSTEDIDACKNVGIGR